jgi:hypothetical protein
MLKIQMEGQGELVRDFLSLIRWSSSPFRLVDCEEVKLAGEGEAKAVCTLERKPLHAQYRAVILEVEDGKQIRLDLKDCQTLEMEDGVTLIRGKSYDIFA